MPPKKRSSVEQTDETSAPKASKSVDDLSSEVLGGQWGDYDVLRDRLTDAGYSDTEVLTKVNERLSRGAPYAYKPSVSELAKQVKLGEWGEQQGRRTRLESAGFSYIDVEAVVSRRGT